MPYKKKEKISLLLYYDYLEQFECLNDEQLRKLIYAMIEFDKNELEIELDKVTKMAFIPIKKRLKLDKENWINTCKANSENAKTRWKKENASGCDRMRKDAKYADIEKEIEKEKEIERERIYNSGKATPTLADIIFYGSEIGASEEYCENFYNHYESIGWVNGSGQEIKNWKVIFNKWFKKDLKDGKTKDTRKKDIDPDRVLMDENGKCYKENYDGTRYYI